MNDMNLHDARPFHYFRIGNEVVTEYLKDIGVYAFAVYAYLVYRADANGKCYPSWNKVAEEVGLARRTIANSFKALREAGLIRCDARYAEDGRRISDLVTILPTNIGGYLVPPQCTSATNPVHQMNQPSAPNEPKQYPEEQDPSNKPPAVSTLSEKQRVLFDRFYQAYPLKKDKGGAMSAWKRINPDEGLLGRMIAAISWQKETADWRKDGGAYIPYPSTWLNKMRWEDEPTDQGSAIDPEAERRRINSEAADRELRRLDAQ